MKKSLDRYPTVRIFSDTPLSELDRSNIVRGFKLAQPNGKISFNKSGRSDLAVVLNYCRKLHYVYGPSLSKVKWVLEPRVDTSFHYRFTRSIPRSFDVVRIQSSKEKNPKVHIGPPLVPNHVPLLKRKVDFLEKTRLVSAIGSREQLFQLHRRRTKFLDQLEESKSTKIDVFGKGRHYLERKSDGLSEYMYSVAIENSVQDNYWTEKITDCFLELTVPIYVGAPNVLDYFPENALIVVPPDSFEEEIPNIIKRLSVADYRRRLPSLREARDLVIKDYNLGTEIGRLAQELSSAAPMRNFRFRILIDVDWFAGNASHFKTLFFRLLSRVRFFSFLRSTARRLFSGHMG